MKKWFFIAALSTLLGAEGGVKKVVFDLTTGDSAVFEKKVLNGIVSEKNYYESKLEELDTVVVIHGEAYKFFVKNLERSPYKNEAELQKRQKELEKRIESLSSMYHVTFLMCEYGMKQHTLSYENIYPFVTLVPNSTIGLIDKQNEGYAYIPIRE